MIFAKSGETTLQLKGRISVNLDIQQHDNWTYDTSRDKPIVVNLMFVTYYL